MTKTFFGHNITKFPELQISLLIAGCFPDPLDIQAMKDEDSLPYYPVLGPGEKTKTALAYFNHSCNLIKSPAVPDALASMSDSLKDKIDTLREICRENDNGEIDDEASLALVEFLDIELELFEEIMCLKKSERLASVKCDPVNTKPPPALIQLFTDMEPVLQSGAEIKAAKKHVEKYCAYLKQVKQPDYTKSKDFRFSMKMFDDFYQCYCEGRKQCGHRLRVAYEQYDQDLGRAFQKYIDAFFQKLEAKKGDKNKSSVGKKYSTALGAVNCNITARNNCSFGACTALQFIHGNVSVCGGKKPRLDFQICSEFVEEISEVIKRFPFVTSKNIQSLLTRCIKMRNTRLVFSFGILKTNGSFPTIPFLNFRTTIDLVFTLRYDSTLPQNNTETRSFLNKGWGKYHYGKLAVDSRIETYEFWSRKWSCVSCRRLVEKAFLLSLQKGALKV